MRREPFGNSDEELFLLAERLVDARPEIDLEATIEGFDAENFVAAALFSDHFRARMVDAILSESKDVKVLTNLPQNLREYFEMGDLDAQLAQVLNDERNQLVTLHGQSGSGKTRAALQYGRSNDASYPGGAWLVSGRAIQTPEELANRFNRFVRSSETNARTLFIVDDLEATSDLNLARLLQQNPNWQLLVTRSQPMGLESEIGIPVQKGRTDSTTLTYFNHLVNRVVRDVEMVASFAGSLRDLSRRLAGVPLALSLAAGCMAQSSPSEISTALTSSGSASDPTTLRQLIQFSMNQLSIAEQRLLTAYSLFAGAFSEVDAQKVIGNQVGVGASLSEFERRGYLEPVMVNESVKYRMLDSIRDHIAADALRPTDLQNYVHLFQNKATDAKMLLSLNDWSLGTNAVLDQLDDFRNSIKLATDLKDTSSLQTFCVSLMRTFFESSLISDFESLVASANSLPELQDNVELQIQILGLQGANAARYQNRVGCEELWQQRLALSKKVGNLFAEADTLTDLAYHAFGDQLWYKCLDLLDQAEGACVRAESVELLATVHVIRARVLIVQKQENEARELLRVVEEELNQCQDKNLSLFVYQSVSLAYGELGEPILARAPIVQLLRYASGGHRSVLTGWALSKLAAMYESDGRDDLAAKCYIATVTIFRRYSSKHLVAAETRLQEYRAKVGDAALAPFENTPWATLVEDVLKSESAS